MCEAFERWPEYSGRMAFPVPHPEFPTAHDRGYHKACMAYLDATNMYVGEYGAARLRLAQFLLDELRKQYPD